MGKESRKRRRAGPATDRWTVPRSSARAASEDETALRPGSGAFESTAAIPAEPFSSPETAREPGFLSPKRGDRIGEDGRFEITEELGAGGMGLVCSAIDRQLDRSVAIKFILPYQQLPWDQLVALLRQEAKATAKLHHDNIVAIFDIGTWKKVPFLVMEHLEGESLDSLLAGGPLGPSRVTEIMIDVARGLEHAHHHGIIHRDLKPRNVFILRDGRAKILDFGLASFFRAEDEAALAQAASSGREWAPHLASAGTPAYMAPEQWRGEAQDGRTDVWAVGVMLFELFTGDLPYSPEDRARLYSEISSPKPAPSVLARSDDLPEEAERIVARALQKDPARRFRSAGELLGALLELQKVLTRAAAARREAPRTSERRQLTFLACRPTGLAMGSEDPDELGESLSTFHRVCADVIKAFDGRIVTSVGGRLLACFGYPVGSEGDAQRAVRVGLRITEAMKRKDAHGSARLGLQVGIHTGLVIVGTEGEDRVSDIQGEAPDIAASLAGRAEADTVVIGHPTYLLVRGFFATEPFTLQSIDPQVSPVAAYKVLGESNVVSRFDQAFSSALTPLVGRQGDVERLLNLWNQAKGSRGQFALLTGEAGIGKSRMVKVVKDRVDGEGGTRMSCQCWLDFRSSAFYPVIELLLRSMEILRQDPAPENLRKVESALSSLGMNLPEAVPLLASLLSIPLSEPYVSLGLDPRQHKKKTIEALATMLLGMAAQEPVLFVVEDLHWTDHSTLELLSSLLDLVADARIMVLLTCRPEFHLPWPERPYLHEIPLDRLSPRLAATMVENAAGDRALAPEVIERLVAKTDGVPLFVEEMTRMVTDSLERTGGASVWGSSQTTAIPATLNELLLARLDRLTAAGREAAQLGAIIGRAFDYPLLRQISPLDDATLQHALESVTEAGVLLSRGEPPESKYQFKHSLIQEAAYQSLPKKKRQEYHLKVAQALTHRLADIAEVQPELLAHHYSEGGDLDQALAYWERAGRRAAERSANVESISHFTRALNALQGLPAGPERNHRELSLQLALGSPLMAVKGYAAPEVERVYARARELCRLAGESSQLFPAVQGLWQFYMVAGELPASRELGEQLLALARSAGDAALLLLAHRSLATTLFLQGEIDACREHTEEGLALYDIRQHRSLGFRYGHDPGVAHGLYAAWALWLLGYPDQALKRALDAVSLAQELSHPVSMAFSRCYLALVHNCRGEYRAARENAEGANAISNAHRLALWLALGTMMLGWARAGLEEREEGIAQLKQGVAAWRETGARSGTTFFLVTLAEAAWKAGRPRDGLDVLAEAETIVAKNSEHYYEAELYRLKGELRLALEPEDQAGPEAMFDRAIDIARLQNAKSLELRATTSMCALLHKRGRDKEARALLAEVYGWFSEGLATADPINAKALLEALG